MSDLDFKAALECFEPLESIPNQHTYILTDKLVNNIQIALRIAERLQSGEVSDEAQDDFNSEDIYHVEFCEDDYFITNNPDDFQKAFKAMSKQLIKECSE
jgi:hypothetical protein